MKYFIYLMVALFCPMFAFCQDITGLWKGTMVNDSTKQSLEYGIVISKKNGKYTGFSHTWFVVNDKKYYGIKKINVRVAKDGKIVMQDAKLIEENYPMLPNKDICQLNVLDLANRGDQTTLNGLFVTNRTKERKEVTGRISIKKVNPTSESDLVQYLEKTSADTNLAVKADL
jgi:hypothetical protein